MSFQLVVLSNEVNIPQEINILKQLFDLGLSYFHLRKPNQTIDEYRQFLKKIDEKYHDKILIHNFHSLINEFNLKGIHFQEQKRINTFKDTYSIDQYFKNLSIDRKDITISSSFHTPKELVNCNFSFDYHFLSPILSSISKKGYEGKGFDVNHIKKKVIGMGGVTSENIGIFKKLGFHGVGILGGIWKNNNPKNEFVKLINNLKEL